MLFAAIAMIAFTVSANAQSDFEDSTVCAGLMNKYKSGLRKEGGLTEKEIGNAGAIYYIGCMDGRKAIRADLQEQKYGLSRR